MTKDRRLLDEALKEALIADPLTAGRIRPADVAAAEVRLLCPRGHFVANVAVIDFGDRGVLLRPRSDGQYFGDTFSDFRHGFRFDHREDEWTPHPDGSGGYRDSRRPGAATGPRIRLRCIREKCSYDGSFDYFALAKDLSAAAGRTHEYRLTN